MAIDPLHLSVAVEASPLDLPRRELLVLVTLVERNVQATFAAHIPAERHGRNLLKKSRHARRRQMNHDIQSRLLSESGITHAEIALPKRRMLSKNMGLKIAYILPRRFQFGPKMATSVDLCVRDLVRFSRHASGTTVFCPAIETPYSDINIRMMQPAGALGNFGRAVQLAAKISAAPFDAAIVEHHLPMATMIASMTRKPIIFHGHAYETSGESRFRQFIQRAKFKPFAAIVQVSDSCASHFRKTFPGLSASVGIIYNGLDMLDWTFEIDKDQTIMVVGRAIPNKGHLEAMAAIVRVFAIEPGWKARFILSEVGYDKGYFKKLCALASQMPHRIKIETDLPYAEVKSAWGRAAIGIVPTLSKEPFGRTAREAMASGAALITSGRGGVAEVCGPHALVADPETSASIDPALLKLMRTSELREALVKPGRRRVLELYDIRRVAASMDDFVDSVLGR